MATLNRVDLIGRLGADPETKTMQNGGSVVTFRLAVSDTWKDRDGNRQERTTWLPVVIFNEGLGKVASSYLKKGSQIFISGSLQVRDYEKDGNRVFVTEVVLQKFRGELQMLDGPSGDKQAGSQRQERTSYDDRDTRGGDALDEDAIPFAPEWR